MTAELERIAGAMNALASEGEHLVETEPLRLLDVALWTFQADTSKKTDATK